VFLATQWLSDKDREAESRAKAFLAEQTDLMRRATEVTERQAIQARRANIAAVCAIVIAVLSLLVSLFRK
jgi:hypothetical protein